MNPAPNQGVPQPGFWRRNRLWIILLAVPLVVLAGVYILGLATANTSGAEPVSYSQFIAQVEDHNVTSVTLNISSVTGTFRSPVVSDRTHASVTMFTTTLPSPNTNVVNTLFANGVPVNVVNNSGNGGLTLLFQWMPLLLQFGIPYLILVGCLALYLSGRPRLPAQHTLA